jgi:hypothetical protein
MVDYYVVKTIDYFLYLTTNLLKIVSLGIIGVWFDTFINYYCSIWQRLHKHSVFKIQSGLILFS